MMLHKPRCGAEGDEAGVARAGHAYTTSVEQVDPVTASGQLACMACFLLSAFASMSAVSSSAPTLAPHLSALHSSVMTLCRAVHHQDAMMHVSASVIVFSYSYSALQQHSPLYTWVA